MGRCTRERQLVPAVSALTVVLLVGLVVGSVRGSIPVQEEAAAWRDRSAEGSAGAAYPLLFVGADSGAPSWFWEMRRHGVGRVLLVVTWHQSDVEADHLYDGPLSLGEDVLVRVMAAAREAAMGVTLMPILYLDEVGPGRWRGTIQPRCRRTWWRSYEERVLALASLAEAGGAERFVVGSELGSMEGDPQWSSLIQGVRERFSGRVTYAANWDRYSETTLWPMLDEVGVSHYAPWQGSAGARIGVDALEDLRAFGLRVGRPVVLVEVGFPSVASAALRPWDYAAAGAAAPLLQAELYEGLFRWLDAQGDDMVFFLWSWFGQGGPQDRGYTPRRKPAAQVLREKRWGGR